VSDLGRWESRTLAQVPHEVIMTTLRILTLPNVANSARIYSGALCSHRRSQGSTPGIQSVVAALVSLASAQGRSRRTKRSQGPARASRIGTFLHKELTAGGRLLRYN
jgi:hypothetical protein